MLLSVNYGQFEKEKKRYEMIIALMSISQSKATQSHPEKAKSLFDEYANLAPNELLTGFKTTPNEIHLMPN